MNTPENNSATPAPASPSRLQGRALASVMVTFSFLILTLSGLILAISPPGRVANWTDWSLLALRKSEWGNLHIWFSLVFLTASGFHIFLNWRPLLGYFKSKMNQSYSFRFEWVLGALLCAVVFIGTRQEWPPFSTVLAATEGIRGSWEKQAGQPPIPHAELLTVKELSEKAGVDLNVALERLSKKGIKGAIPEIRMAALAKENRMPAQQLYDVMLKNPAGSGEGSGHGPAGGGPGQKTLEQFCASEGLDLAAVQARLAAKGIKVTPKLTLRELAVENGYEKPFELLEIIRAK